MLFMFSSWVPSHKVDMLQWQTKSTPISHWPHCLCLTRDSKHYQANETKGNVSPSSSCCFQCLSAGWTNVNDPYATQIPQACVLLVPSSQVLPSEYLAFSCLSLTASRCLKARGALIFIRINWIINIELTRTGAPKGQFRWDTSCLQSELCGASSGHLSLFLSRLASPLRFPTKHRFTVLPIKAHIHAANCQWHDSFGPGLSLSSALFLQHPPEFGKVAADFLNI